MKKNIIGLIILVFCLISCKDRVRNHIKDIQFKGIVLKIFKDKDNHNMYTFKIKTSNNSLDGVADIFPNSWEYAEIGDSIIKEKGELYITIKKKNGDNKIFYFEE